MTRRHPSGQPERSAPRAGAARRAVRTLVLVGVLAAALWFPHAGRFLVVQDDFAHADLGLVLSGSPAARTLAVRDLYRQHRIDRILIIPDPQGPAFEELVKLGLEDPDHPLSERILIASGIPKAQVLFLPTSVDGTVTEARRVREFLRGRMPKRLALITSKSASRRARFIFRRVFRRDEVEIWSSPAPYDFFEADHWWAHPRNALTVVTEYEKLLVNAVTLLLSPPQPS